eukprot:3270305-Pyramimonas_sp.AAC.1
MPIDLRDFLNIVWAPFSETLLEGEVERVWVQPLTDGAEPLGDPDELASKSSGLPDKADQTSGALGNLFEACSRARAIGGDFQKSGDRRPLKTSGSGRHISAVSRSSCMAGRQASNVYRLARMSEAKLSANML